MVILAGGDRQVTAGAGALGGVAPLIDGQAEASAGSEGVCLVGGVVGSKSRWEWELVELDLEPSRKGV